MTVPAAVPPRPKSRQAFVRTKVPVTERVVSVSLLIVLAGIGAAIWSKGRHFDPNRFALRTEALRSTVANVEGKVGTVRELDSRPEEAKGQAVSASTATASEAGIDTAEGENAAAAATPGGGSPLKQETLELQLPGLKPMSPTEFYNPDKLYEKIDGRAPAYLGFNFQQLRCRSFSVTAAAGSFIDVFEYRFDTPINAFGMFALERDPKGRTIEFAPDGYSGEMGYYFRQGACYVQVIASDQNPGTLALAKALAQNRAQALPVDNTGLDGRRRLPSTGLVPGSVAFVQQNAQGQPFLNNVFQANYDFGGARLPFFLMVTTAADAAAAWKSFAEFSGRLGGKMTPLPDVEGAKLFLAENFGTWKVVYQREGELGGVYDAEDQAKAREFVEQYLRGKIP